jgi:hypothetical protein
MPERPPTPAASLTWRLSETVPLGVTADDLLRQRLAALSSIGFLLGYFAMHNQWVQVAWVGLWTAAWFWAGGFQDFLECLRQDRWFMGLAGLMLLMLARSSLLESPGLTMQMLWRGWLGAGLLALVLMTLWSVGRMPRAMVWLGVPLVGVAVLTALGSILVFYLLDADAVFGVRLRNWFIYGGWNSVCTGMTFGFAAVWASHAWRKSPPGEEKWVWLAAAVMLILTTLLTMSRGALLAMVAAHTVWVLVRGWRAALKPMLLLAGCILLFQVSAPLISSLATRDVSEKLGISHTEVTTEMLADGVVAANPAARVLERADNGRFAIYAAAFSSMTTWQDWLFGKGLWSENDFWSCSLDWYPEHLHSIFMDAFVRGGLSGLAGLLLIIGWALRRALHLAFAGEELWLVLAAFGITGLIFDGDSAFSLLTLPRFETLLLWVPLVVASARYQAASGGSCGFAKPGTMA